MSEGRTRIVYPHDNPRPNFPENSLIWVKTVIIPGNYISELQI